VCVVVLGDLARSPRMLNHVDSLLEAGKEVLLIGYGSSPAPPDLRLVTRSLKPYPSSLQRLPRLVSYALKTIWQALTLLLALPLLSPLSHLLVQTPPGVPTLPVLWFYCWCKSISLVVDFHNYSHTILAMATGPGHPLVALTKVLEGWVGARASAALCVTKAMAGDLRENWGIEASVLHDRPPHQFQPLSSSFRSDFLQRLSSTFPDLAPLTSSSSSSPALLVSSTSWTEDEDFGILLSALVMYEERIEAETESRKILPDVICVITGKGPQQQHYLEKIKELGLKHVTFLTPWLKAADYPLMLASADLGVCLHTSSSGLDLPMKVVDMFGCELPVAAMSFPALPELVVDGENGLIFHNSVELAEILVSWYQDFPGFPGSSRHRGFRENLAQFRQLGWRENWNKVALPIFKENPLRPKNLESLTSFLFTLAAVALVLSLLPTTG